MSLPIYQRVAVTDAGDVIPGAEYTVINENTGVAAPIYSDRTGATLLTAPYFADSVGTIQFFIAQGTTFRVAASGGVGTYTDRYVYAAHPQSSATDTTAGSLMAVGAFGLGTSTGPSITNLDTITVSGFYAYTNGATGAPIGDVGTVFHQAGVSAVSGSLRWTQFAISKSSGKSYTRTNDGGTILPWNEIITADAAGNVGIGTSFPSRNIEIVNGTTGAGIRLAATDTAYWDIERDSGTGNLTFTDDAAGTVLTLDQINGNVGIGTNSPAFQSGSGLVIDQTISTLSLQNGSGSSQAFDLIKAGDDGYIINRDAGNLRFFTNDSERARLDSAGNLLVGTTSAYGAQGATISSTGFIFSKRTSQVGLGIDRLTTDGALIELKKDGTAVGYIGSYTGDNLTIGTGDVGVRFDSGLNTLIPHNVSTNANQDATIILGNPAVRFKDLHLSGTAYVGESLGIGTISPSAALEVNSTITGADIATFGGPSQTTYSRVSFSSDVSSTDHYIISYGSEHAESGNLAIKNAVPGGDLFFVAGGTEDRLRITSAGDVGIGTASPSRPIEIKATTAGMRLTDSNTNGYGEIIAVDGSLILRSDEGNTIAGSNIRLEVDGSEKVRIDDAGNLLVGKTAAGTAEGVQIEPAGAISLVRDGSTPLYLNRLTSDGTIIDLRKDGTTVGSISSNNGNRLGIGSADTGLLFVQDADDIIPYNMSTGIGRDNAIDLGQSGNRFKDLYLSGTANANALSTPYAGKIGFNTSESFTLNGQDTPQYGMGRAAVASPMGISGYYGIAFATAVTERMRIASNGDFFVGCTSQPTGGASTGFSITDNGGKQQTTHGVAGTANSYVSAFYNANGKVGGIRVIGSATAYDTSSDYRLKEDDVPMTGATERVKALRPINFAWKVDGSRTDGFFAHEVQKVVPESAGGSKDAMRDEEYEVTPAVYKDVTTPAVEAVLDEDGMVITEAVEESTESVLVTEAVMATRSVPDYQGIDQSKLVPLLTATIQELIARIEALESGA